MARSAIWDKTRRSWNFCTGISSVHIGDIFFLMEDDWRILHTRSEHVMICDEIVLETTPETFKYTPLREAYDNGKLSAEMLQYVTQNYDSIFR